MWHSVVENVDDWLRQDIRNSVSHLVATIRWARDRNLDVVDLDEALSRLGNENPHRFVVLTFDDGYQDNLRLALPICESFGVPMTVFATTGFIARSAEYWWGPLVDLVKRESAIDLPAADRRFPTRTLREKIKAVGDITRWVQRDVAYRSNELVQLYTSYGLACGEFVEQDILNVDELRQLSKHPLVTIGSHTVTHPSLRSLTVPDAQHEIGSSKLWLEDLLQKEVAHFSFPHGDTSSCRDREARLVRTEGYRSAVSTRRGNLFPAHSNSPYMLPRGSVNPNRESIHALSAQIEGLPRALDSRFGAPIDESTTTIRAWVTRSRG